MPARSSKGGDEEHVHQLRIGIRRLRTALRELAPLAPDAFDPAWEPPLVGVFQRLGQLRDQGQALQSIVADLRDAGAPALDVTVAAGQAPAPSAAAIVRMPAFQAALIALMAFTAQGGDAPPAAAEEALDAKDTPACCKSDCAACTPRCATALKTLPPCR